MDGHELDGIRPGVGLVLPGLQGSVGEEVRQQRVAVVGRGYPLAREDAFRDEIAGSAHQFVQVLESLLAFLFRLVMGPQGGALQRVLHHLRQGKARRFLAQTFDQADELGQHSAGLAAQMRHRGVEAGVEGAGRVLKRLQGTGTDTPNREIHDPQESRIVVGIGDQAQVGQGMLHLLAFEEAKPAIHPVGNAGGEELVLQHPGLGIGAVKQGDVAAGMPFPHQGLDFLHHPARLVQIRQGLEHPEGLPFPPVGPQILAEAVAVAASKAARRDNNEKVAGRASKIAFTAFEQRLKDPANPDEVVTLMAGGTGSGKSALKPEHGIVYDSTMYDPVAAKRNVKMVLDSGRGVEYRYVFTEPDSAFRAAIARGKDGGRYVNLTAFVRTHEGAYKTVQELMREYADDGRVKFYLYDNTDFGQRQIEAVPAFDYNGLREHLHAILDQEHAAGRVSDAEYRAIARSEPAARQQGQAVSDAKDAGRGPRADQDRRPEQSEGLVTTPETPPPGGVSASTATHTPLDDFGERLEGARKFLPPSLKETLSNDVIASQPLSKFWPADAYLSIDNPGAAALAYAARAEVPAKPRLKYKVARWVEKVKLLREIMSSAEDRGGLEAFEQKAATLGYGQLLREFFPKARLLAQLPRDTWGRVDRVGEHPDAIRYDAEGKRIASPFSTVTIDGKTQRFDGTGRIGPDEVQRVKDQLAGEGEQRPADALALGRRIDVDRILDAE